jgi:hypothetical protein
MLETDGQPAETGLGARERILDAAYELFSRRGIQAVGINEVTDRAGVAFLDLREQRWTKDVIEAGAMRRGSNPEERLLAIFDVLDEWFHRDDFEAGSFIKVLLELGPGHPAGDASVRHLEQIRAIVRRLAEQAGLRDTDSFAHSWHILMEGSIVVAAEGDAQAARRGKSMARQLIDQYR